MRPIGIRHTPGKLKWCSVWALVLSVAIYVWTGNALILWLPVVLLFLLLCIVHWKNAYWLLLFSIPLSIRFSLATTLSLSLPDEPVCWLLSLVFLLLIAHDPRILPRWWWEDPLVLIIVLQFLWLIVTVACSTVFFLSLKYLAAKTWYLICFLVLPVFIFRDKEDHKRAFLIFLLPLLVTICCIVYRQALFGFDFASIGMAVSDLYMNHVEYAAVVSIFYPLLWIAYPLAKGRKGWVRSCLALLIVLFIPVIVLTYARVAIVAVVFAAAVGLALRLRIAHLVMPAFYAVVIIAFTLLARNDRYIDLHPNYHQTIMHKDYGSHLSSTFRGRDLSSMERLYRWVAAVRMSAMKPVTGYGPHGFTYNYRPYTLTIFKTYSSHNKEGSTTHNYFLHLLAEQGWPGMLLYAILVPAVFAHAQRTYYRSDDRFYRYCTLGLLMAFAASFVNNFFSDLVETHKAGALFYLSIALLILLRRKSNEQRQYHF